MFTTTGKDTEKNIVIISLNNTVFFPLHAHILALPPYVSGQVAKMLSRYWASSIDLHF